MTGQSPEASGSGERASIFKRVRNFLQGRDRPATEAGSASTELQRPGEQGAATPVDDRNLLESIKINPPPDEPEAEGRKKINPSSPPANPSSTTGK